MYLTSLSIFSHYEFQTLRKRISNLDLKSIRNPSVFAPNLEGFLRKKLEVREAHASNLTQSEILNEHTPKNQIPVKLSNSDKANQNSGGENPFD